MAAMKETDEEADDDDTDPPEAVEADDDDTDPPEAAEADDDDTDPPEAAEADDDDTDPPEAAEADVDDTDPPEAAEADDTADKPLESKSRSTLSEKMHYALEAGLLGIGFGAAAMGLSPDTTTPPEVPPATVCEEGAGEQAKRNKQAIEQMQSDIELGGEAQSKRDAEILKESQVHTLPTNELVEDDKKN